MKHQITHHSSLFLSSYYLFVFSLCSLDYIFIQWWISNLPLHCFLLLIYARVQIKFGSLSLKCWTNFMFLIKRQPSFLRHSWLHSSNKIAQASFYQFQFSPKRSHSLIKIIPKSSSLHIRFCELTVLQRLSQWEKPQIIFRF